MFSKRGGGGFILLIAGMFAMTYADTFIECEGNDQTYVELQEDCSAYIFCHGEDSYSDSCPDDSPYFSAEEQTCDTDRSVCKDRAIPSNGASTPATVAATETPTENPVNAATNSSVSVTITIPTVPSPNSSMSSATVNLPTASAEPTTTPLELQTISTVFPATVVPSACPIVDNPNKAIFLPHAKSCSEYFLCYQGVRLPLHCSNLLHFDVRQQKCDYPENVKCHVMDVASAREQCLPHTFDFYPHPRNCNYFYQCTLGYLKVMQCPLNMGWHYEKRACVMRSQAKCYNSFAGII